MQEGFASFGKCLEAPEAKRIASSAAVTLFRMVLLRRKLRMMGPQHSVNQITL